MLIHSDTLGYSNAFQAVRAIQFRYNSNTLCDTSVLRCDILLYFANILHYTLHTEYSVASVLYYQLYHGSLHGSLMHAIMYQIDTIMNMIVDTQVSTVIAD